MKVSSQFRFQIMFSSVPVFYKYCGPFMDAVTLTHDLIRRCSRHLDFDGFTTVKLLFVICSIRYPRISN